MEQIDPKRITMEATTAGTSNYTHLYVYVDGIHIGNFYPGNKLNQKEENPKVWVSAMDSFGWSFNVINPDEFESWIEVQKLKRGRK